MRQWTVTPLESDPYPRDPVPAPCGASPWFESRGDAERYWSLVGAERTGAVWTRVDDGPHYFAGQFWSFRNEAAR